MIKSLDHADISTLSPHSHKFVNRVCDNCNTSSLLSYRDVLKQEKRLLQKTNKYKNLCRKCSCKLFPVANGRTLSYSHRKKLSEVSKRRFADPKNKQYLLDRHGKKNPHFKKGIRINSSGYAVKREFNVGEITLHRQIYEHCHNEQLGSNDYIHHIDGNKLNNDVENLFKCSAKEHRLIHYSLENIAFQLFERGVLRFNPILKQYEINQNLETILMPVTLGFEDVAIQQNQMTVVSRSDISLQSEIINGVFRPTPFIAANMSTVCNSNFCIELYKCGGFGVLHRALPFDMILSEIKKVASQCQDVACSIGIDWEDKDVKTAIQNGANIIFIDIAHGFSDMAIQVCKRIKKYSPHTKVVLGNTINDEMFLKVYKFIDALKVGIAQGFVCETKNTAGCTEKQFSAVWKFRKYAFDYGVSIISDGGIREPADVVKAIGAGAKGIMCGKIFAACPESAAENVMIDGVLKKLYAGMASRYVQESWKGKLKNGCPEGKVTYLDMGEPLKDLINRYSGALRSGISYAGANNIDNFREKVKFVRLK